MSLAPMAKTNNNEKKLPSLLVTLLNKFFCFM